MRRSIIAKPTGHALLGALGLLGCEPIPMSTGGVVEPGARASIPIGEGREGEPSARAGASTSESTITPTSASVPESREWCAAIIDTRPRPLLRTSSFLLAWNEVRVADGHAPAGPIPLNEHDARIAICGAPTCALVEAKLVELNEVGRIAIGAVVPSPAGMLVIPDLSPFFSAQQCMSATEVRSEAIGEQLVHVSATATVNSYPSHHGYYHHYSGCYAPAGRHDMVIDLATGMIVLEIEHRGAVLEVDVRDDVPNHKSLDVTLLGCASTLELAWTE